MKIPPLARVEMDKRWLALFNEQQTWVPAWRDIQRFINPTRGQFYNQIPNWGRQIDHKTQLNGDPNRAARILATGMTSGLTSPSRPWFKLGLENNDLMDFEPVKEWLEVVQMLMMSIYSKSNIYGCFQMIYEEVGSFGTGSMVLLEDFDTVVRAKTFTIGEFMLGQGQDGRVDSFARDYRMTVGQLVEEFGIENVSPQVRNNFERGYVDPWIRVAHMIEPNNERVPDKKDFGNKKWRSVTWEYGSPTNLCLRNKGFDSFPSMCPRWQTTTTSYIYGWGPGHYSLGDARMLMKLEKDYLVALDKVIDPPIQMDSSIQTEANTLPGGITKVSATNPNSGVKSAYQINPDLPAVQNKIQMTADKINRNFFTDLFTMLANDESGKMTAYEVSKRYEEKLMALGPVLERLESELLDPLIERTFEIMMRTGVLPPPPPEIAGAPLKVEYISMLAQAQRMVGSTAIEQTFSFAGNIIGAFPQVTDVLDADEAITEIANMNGVSPKIIRTKDEVAAIRQQRQKAQQQAQMQQEAMAAVQGAKTLSETKTGTGSALDALTGTPREAEPAGAAQ